MRLMSEASPSAAPAQHPQPTSRTQDDDEQLEEHEEDDEVDFQQHAQAPFPAHNHPRVWFLTAGTTPVATVLTRALLAHGDYVVAGIFPSDHDSASAGKEDFQDLLEEIQDSEWSERFKVIEFDARWVA